jgi:hypothetical protein
MLRLRSLAIALVAMTALSAIGSASASATACNTNKEKWVACNASNEELNQQKVEGTGGPSVIKTANLEIQCEATGLGTGYIFGIPVLSLLQTIECKLLKPSTCSVSSAFEGEVSGTLIGAVPKGPPEEELTGNGTGEKIATITITGKCILAGKFALSGTQICQFDSTYATSQETHELTCSAGKLTLGSEAAEFKRIIKDHLKNKGNWSIQLN